MMLIKVEHDFVDKVLSSNDDKLTDVLHRLLWAIHFGKHVVTFDAKDYDQLSSFGELSRMERASVLKAKSMHSRMGTLFSNVNIVCIVTLKEVTHRTADKIFINPQQSCQFEFQEETHLITENLVDSGFFIDYIVQFYQQQKPILHIAINTYRSMGGGDQIGKVLQQEIDLKQHFALAITDSDKRFPNQMKPGATSKKVIDVLKVVPFNGGHYIMKDVKELENLLPFKFFQQNTNLKYKAIVNKKIFNDLSFFDFKEGFYSSTVNDQDYNKYWFKNVVDVNTMNILGIETKTGSKARIIEGLGDKIFEQTIGIMNSSHSTITPADLTQSQNLEWNRIGLHVISWCCCYAKSAV